MLELMQLYFLSDAKADEREICNKPWAQCVIQPWADHLRSLGVDIKLGAPVNALRIEAGRAVGEVGSATQYDHVVMAANLRQVQYHLEYPSSTPRPHPDPPAGRVPLEYPSSTPRVPLEYPSSGPSGRSRRSSRPRRPTRRPSSRSRAS